MGHDMARCVYVGGGVSFSTIRREYVWILPTAWKCSSLVRTRDGSPRLFNLGDCDLPVDAIGIKSDLVADFYLVEHGRILDPKNHCHPFVHIELFDRPMLKSDLARGLVDLGHLTVDHRTLG